MPTPRRNNNSSSTTEETPRVRNASSPRPAAQRRRIANTGQSVRQGTHRRPPVRRRYEDDEDEKKTPLLLRVLSWLGVILLCFVLGYLGTSWLMELLNRKLLLKPENRIENQSDLLNYEEREQNRSLEEILNSGSNAQQVSLNLYYADNETISDSRQSFLKLTDEDNIRSAIDTVVLLSDLPNADNIKLLHVFKDNDTAFLDMPEQFSSALNAIGQRKSLLLLTAIVRTLQENFSPLSQVRFLINSQPPKAGGVVDLSAPWKMPKRN